MSLEKIVERAARRHSGKSPAQIRTAVKSSMMRRLFQPDEAKVDAAIARVLSTKSAAAELQARLWNVERRQAMIKKAKDEGGKWVTMPNGEPVFIPDGKDPGDAIMEHFKKKDSGGGTSGPRDTKAFKDSKRVNITIENIPEKHDKNIKSFKDAWNSLNSDFTKHVSGVILKEKLIIDGDDCVGGMGTNGVMEISIPALLTHQPVESAEGMDAESIQTRALGVLLHEGGHSLFHSSTFAQQRDFYEEIKDVELTEYSGKWRQAILEKPKGAQSVLQEKLDTAKKMLTMNEKRLKEYPDSADAKRWIEKYQKQIKNTEKRLDKAKDSKIRNPGFYDDAKESFANETFAEFFMMANGLKPTGANEEAFQTVKTAYEKIFGKFKKSYSAGAERPKSGTGRKIRLQISKTVDSVYTFDGDKQGLHYLAKHES